MGRNAITNSIGVLKRIEPPPERNEETGQNDDRGDRDDHRRGLEESRHPGAHPGQIHVMGPNDEGEEPDGQRGIDQAIYNPTEACGVLFAIISATIPMAGRIKT